MKTKIILYIIISFITAHQLSAQVDNGNTINYEIRAISATTNKDDGGSLDKEEVHFILGADESTSTNDEQVNYGFLNSECFFSSGNFASGFVTIALTDPDLAEIQRAVLKNNNGPEDNFWLNFSSSTWEEEEKEDGSTCEYTGSDKQRVLIEKRANITQIAPPGKATTYDIVKNGDRSSFWVKWRYVNGTKDQPLDFGDLPVGIRTHNNGNWDATESYSFISFLPDIITQFNTNVGYANEDTDGFSPDVHYKFNIDEEGKTVTFSLENLTDGLAPNDMILILTGPNNTYEYISGTSFSKDLCPGIGYKLVVDGKYAYNQGQFTLKIQTASLSMNPGTLSTQNFGRCDGAPIDIIYGGVDAGAVNFDPIVYAWEKSTDGGSNWNSIIGADETDLDSTRAGAMPNSDIMFRREAKSCGFTVYTDPLTITKQNSTVDAGSIVFIGDIKIPENGDPGMINNQTSGSGTPNFDRYIWEENTQGTWEVIVGATNDSYDIPSLCKTTKFRRVAINDCDKPANSNEIEVIVLPSEGTIKGKVTSRNPGLAPLEGITITAVRQSTILGGTTGPGGNDVYTAVTDDEGKYTIRDIYYGETTDGTPTEFELTPSRPDNSTINFAYGQMENLNPPRSAELAMNTNEIEEQDFVDLSTFSYTGKVFQFFEGVQCGIDSIVVDAGIAKDTTETAIILGQETKGNFNIAIPSAGTYTITPSFGDHDFDPPFLSNVFINQDEFGVEFEDTTTHEITGFVGGGCGKVLGSNSATMLSFVSSDLCIQKMTTVSSNGTFHQRLPARKYDVTVSNFDNPSPYGELEVLAFFQTSIEIDLTERGTVQDFIYKPEPTILVTGLPASKPGCVNSVLMEQGVPVPITIQVFEGDPMLGCPLDTGYIIITDDISDRNSMMIEIPISQGMATYEILPGAPEVIAPHLKNLSIVARDTTGQSDIFSTEVIVTGTQARDGTFTTVTPEIPLLILRDPPGDESFSWVEKNQTFEVTNSFYALAGGSINTWAEVKLGVQFEAGFIGFDTESEFYGQIGTSMSVGGSVTTSNESVTSITITESFYTNDGDQVVGGDGDVYVGAAMNLLYAVSDVVEFDDVSCVVTVDKKLIIAPTGFETEYIYTEDHIKNTLIPGLRVLAENGGGPQGPDFFYDQINVWEQTLQLNQDLKDAAIPSAPFQGNKSFSANTTYVNSVTSSTSQTKSLEFNVEIEAEVAVEVGMEVAGSGASGGYKVALRTDIGKGKSQTTTQDMTVGFELKDGDQGDFFSVDIFTDPVYMTPVFKTISGTSSCPHEEGTQARDQPELTVDNPAVKVDIAPNGEGEFTLRLKNNTPSNGIHDQEKTYTLTLDESTNSSFAIVKINNSIYNGPRDFDINAGQQQAVQIKVGRGSANIYSYEGLEFVLSSECEPDINERVSISAFFDSPCSAVRIETPIDDWYLNGGSNNIAVHLKDYDKANLDQIQIQYDTVGNSQWINAAVLNPSDLNNNNPSGTNLGDITTINLASVPNGEYNIRAKLICNGSSSVSSERVRGTIKRSTPEINGIPSPANDELDQMTDSLRVVFNESVSCAQASATITDISTEATFSSTVMCFINTAVVYPVSTLPQGEYAVELCGMIDVAGNEIDCYTWYFVVDGYPEDCGPLDVENNNTTDANATNYFTSIETGLYQGATVRSDNIIITPGGDVHFQGENSVSLNPGFEVPSNSVFLANIDDCDPTADDPVPCEFGIPIALGNYYSGNTDNAIPNNSIPPITGGFCNTQLDPTIPIQWYQYEGQGFYVDLSICGYVGFDIQLIAFSGDCKDGLFCVTAESGSSANLPLFNAPIGETFYIAVTGTGANESGEYTLVFDTSNSTSLKSACHQIYVDEDATGANDGTTWTDAYTTLQDALAHTGGFNDEIWVADGTYYTDIVTNDRDATFELNPNQTIYGGLAGNEPKGFDMDTRDFEVNESILSGEMGNPQDNSDNSYHVTTYTQGGFDQTPILDGVTIEGGYADGGIPRNQAIGTALDFQSGNTSDHVQIPHSSNLTLTDGDFSIEAWVNPSTGDYNAIASKGHGGSYNTEFIFSIMADNDPNAPSKLGLFLNRVFDVEWQYSNTSIPQNTWSHVAISVDLYVTDQFGEDYEVEVSFYLNGVLDGVKRYNNIFLEDSPLYSGNTPLYIGMQGDNCRCNHFDGALDDISLWNKALTQAEISSAEGKHSGNESDLVAYYSFQDGDICADNFSNLTLTDQSPNGHDGTLKNFDLSQGCVSNWVGGNPDQALQNNQDFRGGGLHLDNNGLAVIQNCTFRDNYAYFGGAVGSSNTIIANGFVNTLFLGNTAETGGAIYSINDNNESFVYCTFYGNQALGQGDAIAVADGTTAIVTNSILWGNNPDSLGVAANRVPIDVLSGGNITAQNNIIENGSSIYGASGNNQFADPRFVNPAASRNLQDYRLQDGSPAIDAGLDQFFDADHDGYSRSTGGAPDMGAYESGSSCRNVVDTDGDGIFDCEDLCKNTPDMSLDFDGINDHVTVPHESEFNLSASNFTIQAWVFIRDNSANTIVSKGRGTDGNRVFSLVASPEGDQKLGLYMSDGFNLELEKSNGEIPLTTWTHVAVTFDLASRSATFYINGVKDYVSKVYAINSFNSTDTDPLYIGRNGHVAADSYFKGRMDNLAIWGVALTDAQVTMTMSARLVGSELDLLDSDLMVYYEFDDSPACVGGGNTLAAKSKPVGQCQGTLIDFDLNNGCISNWAPGPNVDSDGGGRGDACEEISFLF